MVARRAAWFAAPLVFFVSFALFGLRTPTYFGGDFRAFYCAGAAIAERADPYRQEPLHACELAASPPATPEFLRGVALPAPLPPHALLPFVPLSRLPFPVAVALFTALSLAASAASVLLFARVTGASTLELNLAFAAIAGSVTFYVGQPIAFVLLALAGTALSLRNGRWWIAAACATAATIEPHVALPVLVTMAIALPRVRLPLLVCLGSAAVAGILAVGIGANVEYVREVLPAHALANAYEWQYSLTSVLTSAGVGGPLAVRLGELMFATMVVLGAAVALRIRALTGDAAALVVIPPAFALFGGVHVHIQQIAAAFPAALYVATRFPRVRVAAAAGLAFVMIPWNVICSSPAVGFAPLLVGAFGAVRIGRRAGLILAASAALIAFSLLLFAFAGLGPHDPQSVVTHYPPDTLAERSWEVFSRTSLMRSSVLMQWLRLPTLAGFACILVAIACAAQGRVPLRRSRRVSQAVAPLA